MSFGINDARQLLVRVGSAAVRGEIDQASRDERDLWRKTLQAIANGHADPVRLAGLAVKSLELRFDRAQNGGDE